MPFPSATPLATALQNVLQLTSQIKSVAANRRATMAAGPVTADFVLDVQRSMHNSYSRLQTLGATPGLAAYAKAQFDNAALDIAAEFTSLRNAIQAVRDHIESVIPKDGSGYLLVHQFAAHDVSPRSFSVAQTATLRTLLQAVVDAVD